MKKILIILFFASLFSSCDEKTKRNKDKRTSQVMEKYYENQLCECLYTNGPGECLDLWKKYEKKTGKQGDDLECVVEAMMDMEEQPAEEIDEYEEDEYYDDEFEEEVYYDKEYNRGGSIFEGDFGPP